MKKIFLLLLVPIMLISVLGGCIGFDLEEDQDDAAAVSDDYYYIAAAKQAISDDMLNPSTSVYNSAYVYEEDGYGRAIVYLDVSYQGSQSTFRDKLYVCIIKKNDGKFYWHDTMSYCSSTGALSLLKNFNNWGEPQ